MSDKINVRFFQRKPYASGYYSLEFIFSDIRSRLTDKINARLFISSFYSNGIIRRIFNVIEAWFRQGDVNIICGDIHYICFLMNKKKTVLSILDCGFLYDSSGIKRWLQLLLWLKIPILRVNYITTISEYSKNDIIYNTSANPDKVIVIPVAINEIYKHYPKIYNNEKPVLLQVGEAENKNLVRIIEAIRGLEVKLSIVGKVASKNIRFLNQYDIDYTNAYGITDAEVLQRYIECDILLFPSTFEGFGMPILEAQAVGRPVITSTTTSMPWVAGDAACFVDPYSTESIRSAILKIIRDNRYREELVLKGLENVKRFNPEMIAGMYYDIFQKIKHES